MRESGLVCAEILEELCRAAKPGVATFELDLLARRLIAKHNVQSAFLGYYDYPAVICASINSVIVHGIPRKEDVLQSGDIVGLDFGIFKNGFCADTARTVIVGSASNEDRSLVVDTQRSLQLAIELCHVDNRLGDLGSVVQTYAESKGYGVVRDFVGHGIGRRMHEEPAVRNFGRAGEGKRLKRGLVIAIEPMVNAGTPEHIVLDDEWTAVTKDRKNSAHFEHTVAITDNGPWVLTRIDSEPGVAGTLEPITFS